MRYMVSFKYRAAGYHDCGNQTFDDLDSVRDYIIKNRHLWVSHSVFQYEPHYSGISTLLPLKEGLFSL